MRLDEAHDKPFDEIQRTVLKFHIDETIRDKQYYFNLLAYHRKSFQHYIPENWKRRLLFYVYRTLNIHCNNVKQRLSTKLRCLIRKSDWSNSVNNNCFINLSSKVLSEDTKSSLGYGMNFNVSNYHVNPTEITKGFVKLQKYNNLDASVLDICKGFVYNSLSSANYESCPRRFVIAYNSLKKDKDLHITKADKSNALVIIDKQNYVNKMKELLADNNVIVNCIKTL